MQRGIRGGHGSRRVPPGCKKIRQGDIVNNLAGKAEVGLVITLAGRLEAYRNDGLFIVKKLG
jgi:hypothetical protein